MLDLYLMRGPQGSGKTTFLNNAGLLPWTVTPDQLRRLYGSFAMGIDGHVGLSHEHEDYVWAKLKEIVEYRMRYGETTIIDATNTNPDYKRLKKLADDWGYNMKVISMGESFDFDHLNANVLKRASVMPETLVPEASIRSTLRDIQAKQVPGWVPVLTPDEALAELNVGPEDLNGKYRNILFVGDIQGCATPLKRLLDSHYADDTLIILVGDLFDRGPENGEVFTIVRELLKKPNVRLMCGNHERHVLSWMKGRETPREFSKNTLPQLWEAGFTMETAEELTSRWDHLLQLKFGEAMIQVTHGGAPAVIERPRLFAGHQCWKGVANYRENVDEVFDHTAPAPWFQVHGHRNAQQRDLRADQRSFNLESSVEFGGTLRALSFNGEQFEPIHVNNRVFIAMANRNLEYDDIVPEWILRIQQDISNIENPEVHGTVVTQELIDELRGHNLMRERVQEGLEHASSFNFTREAFYDKSYDTCCTMARGLFINTSTREIVIRGYDKYFNVNERGIESAKLAVVLENTTPPYTTSIKENGYLGLVGYDRETDSIICASKSTISGEHAQWFKEQVYGLMNDTKLQNLKIVLRDCQLTLAFEVIEPERDPHIIEYPAAKLVLLDGIRRSLEFAKISRKHLQVIANSFGFECKAKGPTHENKRKLAEFLISVSRLGFRHNNQEIEGLVVEDALGNMTKLKLPYYSLWKACRSAMEAVVRNQESGSPIKAHHLVDPTVAKFVEWLLIQDPSMARKDIITARKAFLNDHPDFSKADFKRYAMSRETELQALDF